MDSVRLRLAWAWECRHCGETNYHSGVKVDDPDMQAQARVEHGCDGDLVLCPVRVCCSNCELTYDVVLDEEA